jgi:hypothetical protein
LGDKKEDLRDTLKLPAGGLLLHLRTMGDKGEAKLARKGQTPPNPGSVPLHRLV